MSKAKHAAPETNRVGAGIEIIASLNADGTQKWFIPPYVMPVVVAALVVVSVISRS